MGTAPNEELCLRWNDFESILSRSFSEMRDESDFFDVRVACLDEKSVMKTLPAHRVVLSACSPVFKELLRVMGRTGDSKGPLIFLRGISYHEMEAVLDFMYNGQTKVQHTDLDAFLAAAEELKIKGLTTNTGNQSGSSGESTSGTSRKRESESFDNGLKMKTKKSKPNLPQAGPSSATRNETHHETGSGNMVVKAEEVNLEVEDDSFQDYAEAELEEPFDESAYQDHDGTGADNFPTDSKELEPLNAELFAHLPAISDKKERTKILREKFAVTDENSGKLICTLCQMPFANTYTLVRHIEAAHIQLRTYMCQFCNKTFKTQSQKADHTKKMHLTQNMSSITDIKIQPQFEFMN
jgi:chemotaxis protein histidine kinase CheA